MESVTINITPENSPAEIVKNNFRTATVFSQYGIGFCCGGNWPLSHVCELNGIAIEELLRDLKQALRTIQLPAQLAYQEWKAPFLIDYITNVHHYYLRKNIPVIQLQLEKFIDEHQKKYPSLIDLMESFNQLISKMVPHLDYEEEVFFPYIKQVAHAYESIESYAPLLFRTLQKPVEDVDDYEHQFTFDALTKFRQLTNNYQPPEKACTSHRLSFSLLKELDDDLIQHLYLENEVLIPKAILMEQELGKRQ